MAKRNKQERLPGVEGGIPELEQLGYEYAALRDKRMALLREEVKLKGQILEAMHQNNLKDYKYEDLKIEIIPGEEKLKVKSEKTDEGEEDAA